MERKFAKIFLGCIAICFVCFFWTVKAASKVFAFSINLYPCTPFFSVLNKRNSLVPRFVGFADFSVKTILLLSATPKIVCAIVGAITINMINNLGRPTTGYEQPSNTMSIIKPIINANPYISMRVDASRSISYFSFASSFSFPRKFSGFWIVIQKLKHSLGCDVCFHDKSMSSLMTFVNRRMP